MTDIYNYKNTLIGYNEKITIFLILLFLSNLILNLEDRRYIDTTRGVYQTTEPHPN